MYCLSLTTGGTLWVKSVCVCVCLRLCVSLWMCVCVCQCYKCAQDLLPQLELNLQGCQLVYKSKCNRKVQHQLKLVLLDSETLVLGYSSFQQADEWRRVWRMIQVVFAVFIQHFWVFLRKILDSSNQSSNTHLSSALFHLGNSSTEDEELKEVETNLETDIFLSHFNQNQNLYNSIQSCI